MYEVEVSAGKRKGVYEVSTGSRKDEFIKFLPEVGALVP